MKKRLLSVLLILALLLAALPAWALAADVSYGIEGDTLTVSGASIGEEEAPWAGEAQETLAAVTKIVVSDGAQTIVSGAFSAFSNLTELTLPGTLRSFAAAALPSGFNLGVISYPTDVQAAASAVLSLQEGVCVLPQVPAREHYAGAWQAFTLRSGEAASLTAVYTPVSYTVTFQADGKPAGTASYTVESAGVTEPAVPEKAGYTGAWESYTLRGGDLTVKAVYTLASYQATFVADGKTVAAKTFTVADKSVTAPAVPEKAGYTGAWEAYSLGAADLTIQAVYTPISYKAVFVADGKTVATVPFTVEDASLQEPEVPAKAGYRGAWGSYTLGAGDITVEAAYTFETYTGTVTASVLNVRTGPGTQNSRAGTLTRGSSVTITQEQSDGSMVWGKLPSGNWISLTYVSKNASSGGTSGGQSGSSYTATVSASVLNVRSGAGLGNAVQGSLTRGSGVTVVEEQSASGMTWCRLSTGGWVSKNYLTNITQTAAPQPEGGSSGQTGGAESGGQQGESGFQAYTATVNASYLFIRSGPGTANGKLGGLGRGSTVTVTAEATDASGMVWGKISSGWVSKTYLTGVTAIDPSAAPETPAEPQTPAAAKTYRVTASLLNKRGGPGTGYSVVGGLYFGTQVTVTETSGNWGRLSDGSWICMDYTQEVVTVDTSAFANTYATFSTDCSNNNYNRRTNLILACQAINGTVLTPGSTFSFNGVVGQRLPSKGYLLASYIGAGGVTYGGGVCQVATTVFNAALRANLEITARYQHSLAATYVGKGWDATVSWGALDFCFRNSSPYTIMVYAYCDGNTVTVSLLTAEQVSPGNVTLEVVSGGGAYRLNRYLDGVRNYTTVSYY